MRNLILGVSAIALSGCSWLGLGGNSHNYQNHNQYGHSGSYNYQQKAPSRGCNSGNCLSRWNLEAAVGPTFNVAGTAVTGDRATAAGSTINNIKFHEAYKPGVRGEVGGSYALSPNRKITGNVFYEEANSDRILDWGTIGTQNLTGSLSDYKTYGAELGLRQYFAPRRGGAFIGKFRPYVEGKLGATHIDDITIQNSNLGGAPFSATDVPFYRSGWVGSAAGLVGVETPIARHATIALESGVRYTQAQRTDTSVIGAGSALAGVNNGGSRTSIPVMLRGRYRF